MIHRRREAHPVVRSRRDAAAATYRTRRFTRARRQCRAHARGRATALCGAFGLALAFRPRRRSQGHRKVVVIQTHIMLAVVGAVIMLVVGNSLSRAFGIVGAAGLIRYRSNIADLKDAVVMLSSLAAGLAVGVSLIGSRRGHGVHDGHAVAGRVLRACRRASTPSCESRPPGRRFRANAEDVLKGLNRARLLVEDQGIRYIVSAPSMSGRTTCPIPCDWRAAPASPSAGKRRGRFSARSARRPDVRLGRVPVHTGSPLTKTR